MENYIWNFIVNVLLMVITILSILELIYDSSIKGNFFKKIKKRGWILIFVSIMSVAFNAYRDWNAELNQSIAEKAKSKSDSLLSRKQSEILQLQNSAKDSIIKKVDSTYVRSIKASNEALAKYNLKITDSLHAVVSKLKLDASNPQIMVVPAQKGKQPAFLVKEGDKDVLKIQFMSSKGTCYRIRIDCYLLKETSQGDYSIIGGVPIFFGENFLTENVVRTARFEILPKILNETAITVLLTGTFSKDTNGSSIVSFNDAFDYNFKDKQYIAKRELQYENLKRHLNLP